MTATRVIALALALLLGAASAFLAQPPPPRAGLGRAATLDGKDVGPAGAAPVGDTVLVKKDKPEEKTQSGLFIPDDSREDVRRGTVVAAGPGRTHHDTGVAMPMKVQPGDRVLWGGRAFATEVKVDDEDHILIRDDEILARWSGELSTDSLEMVGDRVMVKVSKVADRTLASGVMLTQEVSRSITPTTGEVVKVGEGKRASNGKLLPVDVQPGDCVKFREFAAEKPDKDGLVPEGFDTMFVRNVDIVAKW